MNTTTKTEAESVLVIGPNLPDQSKGQFHVHASGCSAGSKLANRVPYGVSRYAAPASLRAIVLDVYDPDCFGYDAADADAFAGYAGEFYVCPCARKAVTR